MRPRRPVVIEVTDLRALVPRPRQPEREPSGLTPEVLTAIGAYADRVVGEAAPMTAQTRAAVAALLRAGAPACTENRGSAPHDARRGAAGDRSGTAA